MSLPNYPEETGVRIPASLLGTRAHSFALLMLCLILGGMVAVPMLPGWQGLARLLAFTLLVRMLPSVMSGRIVRVGTALVALAAALAAVSWLQSAASNPGRHVVGIITDVYGFALPVYGGLALTLVDILLLAGIARLLLDKKVVGRVRISFGLALIVWACSLSGPTVMGLRGSAAPELLAQMLAGSAEWAGWVLLMGLCLILLRGAGDIRILLIATVFGGLAMALVMALQFAFADFAYVLDSPDLRDYFYRVRGTAYYHAPATYTASLTLLLVIGLLHARPRGSQASRWRNLIWGLLAISLTHLVTLNDTRALNVALVAALGLMAVLVLKRRDWTVAALTFLLMFWIGHDMLYIKPVVSGSDLWFADADAAFQEEVEALNQPPPRLATDRAVEVPNPGVDPSLLETLADSNQVRLLLAMAGLAALPQHIVVGSGVGTLDLNLGGLSGISTTYSTHILYSDIALMAGLPAAAAFVLMLLLAFRNGLDISTRRAPRQRPCLGPALLCTSVVLGLGAAFLPQERNHIVALFFVFSALLLALDIQHASDTADTTEPLILRPRLSALAVVLAIAAVGWGAMTSATYTLPVLNLVARHADAIAAANARVYVTEAASVPLARLLLRARGVPDPQVSLLADDPALLPQNNAYIIWHPARDQGYPNLKASLPYRQVRPGSDAPSLELSSRWWMLDAIPYAGYLLYAGPRPAQEVFDWALKATDIPADMSLLPNVGRFVSFAQIGYSSFTLPRDILDMNPSTHRVWTTSAPPTFYFDTSTVPAVSVGAYRFVPPAHPSVGYDSKIGWQLQGSDDLQTWVTLDSRAAKWSADAEAPSGFAISNPRIFRYLRLQFYPTVTPSMVSSLGDLELYPSPTGQHPPGRESN